MKFSYGLRLVSNFDIKAFTIRGYEFKYKKFAYECSFFYKQRRKLEFQLSKLTLLFVFFSFNFERKYQIFKLLFSVINFYLYIYMF